MVLMPNRDLSDYDSSDEEWRASQSRAKAPAAAAAPKRAPAAYRSLDDDNAPTRKSLLDPNDPFGDEDDELQTPVQERQRMQCGFYGAFALLPLTMAGTEI
jgi:hypothetical protein